MKPEWEKLASLAQEICTLKFQFFGAVFASKGYPFKNIIHYLARLITLNQIDFTNTIKNDPTFF